MAFGVRVRVRRMPGCALMALAASPSRPKAPLDSVRSPLRCRECCRTIASAKQIAAGVRCGYEPSHCVRGRGRFYPEP